MSTAGRPEASAPADSLAAAIREAGFVRLAATADGDALAALATTARACRAADVPFQAAVDAVPRPPATDADVTVTFGANDGQVAITDAPLSTTAYDAAQALGTDPDPLFALAGAVAGGAVPGEDAPLYEAVEPQLERRPGVAIPTTDVADGLAHSTQVHASFSGDREATTEALAALDLSTDGADQGSPEFAAPDLGDDAYRRVASMVGLRAVEDAIARAAEAVERALHPYVGGPFETLGGYADVLEAVAREAPGVGVALALGRDVRADALDAWREHGRAAHGAVRAAETARHQGLFVARTRGPADTVAGLLRDFRSPEPVVLVLAGETAALATVDRDAGDVFRQAAGGTDAKIAGRGSSAVARGVTDDETFVAAVREVVA